MTGVEAPVRTVWVELGRRPDGRKRAFAVPYDSDGRTIRPAAILLWTIDRSSPTDRGWLIEGRSFLGRLDGTFVKAMSISRELSKTGEMLAYDAGPLNEAPKKIQAEFENELNFWLRRFDKAGWKRGTK